MKNYSQNDEQQKILEYFNKRSGTLLDIGAFDGMTFSNSRALLEMGWRGILVEPDPFNLVNLIKNSEGLNVEIVCAAVQGRGMIMENQLTELTIETQKDRGWASTITERLRGADRIFAPCKIKTSVASVEVDWFRYFNEDPEADQDQDYDFITIDAEGQDFSILKQMPPEMLKVGGMLCVEPTDQKERSEMKSFLAQNGFEIYHETPENIMAVHMAVRVD